MLQRQRNTASCIVFALTLCALVVPGLKADVIAYATLQNSITDTFGTLDLNTGVFTPINTLEPSQLQLASFDGSLYAIETRGNSLYQVDPTTGDLTTIGSLGSYNAGQIGATSSELYAELLNNTLDSVNPATAGTTPITSDFEPTSGNWYALSNNGSSLYLSVESTLYSVAANGSITAVGTNYGTPVAGQGTALIGALLFDGGVLYGGQEEGYIDTINTTTGVATNLSTLQGVYAGEAIYGLAPDTVTVAATPEPGSLPLLVLALAAIACWRCRRLAR
jgi:hypothetical protein